MSHASNSHSLTSLRRFYNAVLGENHDEFIAMLNEMTPSEANRVGQKATEGISRSHNPRYAQRLVIPGGSR